tara:strand:+ start:1028 stop:1246 length:219 start_codon:yes stop_codon:yes gene_type:complete
MKYYIDGNNLINTMDFFYVIKENPGCDLEFIQEYYNDNPSETFKKNVLTRLDNLILEGYVFLDIEEGEFYPS